MTYFLSHTYSSDDDWNGGGDFALIDIHKDAAGALLAMLDAADRVQKRYGVRSLTIAVGDARVWFIPESDDVRQLLEELTDVTELCPYSTPYFELPDNEELIEALMASAIETEGEEAHFTHTGQLYLTGYIKHTSVVLTSGRIPRLHLRRIGGYE